MSMEQFTINFEFSMMYTKIQVAKQHIKGGDVNVNTLITRMV